MEQENEQEWIGGRNPVLEVLRSDRDIHKIYVQEGSQKGVLKQVLTLAKERKIQVQFVPKQKIRKSSEWSASGCCSSSGGLSICGVRRFIRCC